MNMKRICRLTALLLAALLLLLSLASCNAARRVRPSANAKKTVATAGEVKIPYQNLYYVTMTRIAEMKRVHGDNVFEDATRVAELESFVRDNLLSREQALLQLGAEYGLDADKGDIADAVQADIEELIENSFGGDRDAYIAKLNEQYMTDDYLRTYLAVNEHLPAALVEKLLQEGKIDDSEESAKQRIEGDGFIRTIHLFIDRGNGKTDEENRANASAISTIVSAGKNETARYLLMHDAIGGVHNNDHGDTMGHGYYLARGESDPAYEEAAFALKEYGVSNVVETVDGYYVIMRMPKDASYISEHFEELKQRSYYVELNRMVDERMVGMELKMTDYGEELDLLDLPPIDAGGGEVAFAVTVVLCSVVGAAAVITGVVLLVKRLKGRGGSAQKTAKRAG